MAESVCKTFIAHKVLSHWNFLLHIGICSIFQKAAEVNTIKLVVMKRTQVNQEKILKNRKFRGQKTAKKGGKTAEQDGLWKLRFKSCRKHVQKVLSQILILLAFFPVVKPLLKAAIQVTQCRCKPPLDMCNHENIYTVLYGLFSVCSVFLAAFIT